MSQIWMDVDTALASVPVNAVALIDDTDFKTIEDAVVYNQAGLALFWNFTTTAGVTTVTAVTPTTAGVYDWTDFSTSGFYGIEIPASGGASIRNDAEGFGFFSGVATGILPWRGPTIGFRAAALNNLLVDDAFSATRGLAGTALPAAAADAAGGLAISDAGGLALDTLDSNVSAVLTDTAELGAAVGASISADIAAVKTDSAAVLVDTADMQPKLGTPAADIAADIAAVKVDSAAVLVDTAELGAAVGASISADIAAVKADSAAVLVDTADMQPKLGTPAADVSADIAAVKSETALIVADTNELQTDWVNGGRLDLLVDAIKLVTDLLPDAGALTAIGVDTARLTAVRAAILTDWIDGGRLDLLLDAIPTTAMRGTDSAALATVLGAAVGASISADVAAVKAETSLIVADTNELQSDDVPTLIAALNDISAANVNTEMADVMNTDTHAQPGQGALPATASFEQMITYIYKFMRNKSTQDDSDFKVYNDDAATVDHKATVGESGGTITKGEIVTGP